MTVTYRGSKPKKPGKPEKKVRRPRWADRYARNIGRRRSMTGRMGYDVSPIPEAAMPTYTLYGGGRTAALRTQVPRAAMPTYTAYQPKTRRKGASERSRAAWGARYQAQAEAQGAAPRTQGANISPADVYSQTLAKYGREAAVNAMFAAIAGSPYASNEEYILNEYNPSYYYDMYQSIYGLRNPRYPSPMGPIMVWSDYAAGYGAPAAQPQAQQAYTPYGGGYPGYGYGPSRRFGGGGGGGGGGGAGGAGRRVAPEYMSPWYQALVNWKVRG